jgi:HAD superfamily hydrolase (TIGR01509 family)
VLVVPKAGEPPTARPPTPRAPGTGIGSPDGRRPVDGVLLDFHGTLAQVEDPIAWVLAGAASCNVRLDRARATVLADRLLTAGRAGGPLPSRVPAHLADVWADRDLSGPAHRAAYVGLAATVDTGVPGLPEVLYERVLRPEGWMPYRDAEVALRALRAVPVPVAVVSNIGFDIRPLFAVWGLLDLVNEFVLSYEVGRRKPDPAIFRRACDALGVDPERALMVGDTPADAGAVRAGCATLVLPAAPAGRANGLAAVLDLVAATR